VYSGLQDVTGGRSIFRKKRMILLIKKQGGFGLCASQGQTNGSSGKL
jgi:hypothetical protein